MDFVSSSTIPATEKQEQPQSQQSAHGHDPSCSCIIVPDQPQTHTHTQPEQKLPDQIEVQLQTAFTIPPSEKPTVATATATATLTNINSLVNSQHSPQPQHRPILTATIKTDAMSIDVPECDPIMLTTPSSTPSPSEIDEPSYLYSLEKDIDDPSIQPYSLHYINLSNCHPPSHLHSVSSPQHSEMTDIKWPTPSESLIPEKQSAFAMCATCGREMPIVAQSPVDDSKTNWSRSSGKTRHNTKHQPLSKQQQAVCYHGRWFHPECFKCHKCGVKLSDPGVEVGEAVWCVSCHCESHQHQPQRQIGNCDVCGAKTRISAERCNSCGAVSSLTQHLQSRDHTTYRRTLNV